MSMVLFYITLLLLAVCTFILFKILKHTVRIVFAVIAILSLLFLIVGVFLMADAENYRQNFPVESKLFLLKEDTTLVAAFSTTNFEDTKFFTESDLSTIRGPFESNDLEGLKGGTYDRVYIIDALAFQNAELSGHTIPGSSHALSPDKFYEYMTSDVAFQNVYEEILQHQQSKTTNPINEEQLRTDLSLRIGDNAQVRSRFFSDAFETAIQQRSLVFILESGGLVTIHPNPLIFKLRPVAPLGLLENIMVGLRA